MRNCVSPIVVFVKIKKIHNNNLKSNIQVKLNAIKENFVWLTFRDDLFSGEKVFQLLESKESDLQNDVKYDDNVKNHNIWNGR